MRRSCVRMVVTLVALAFAGCVPDFAKVNQTGFVMMISNIRAANGTAGAPMISSVRLPATNDDVVVTVSVVRKDPNVTIGNDIENVFLDRYEVHFFRSDGHNTEGVDVPYSISGPLGTTRLFTPQGHGSNDVTVNITLVRHQAKLEPPLRNLASTPTGNQAGSAPQFSGPAVITTVAELTVYGRTVNDKGGLSAKGQIQVTFGDFPVTGAAPTPTFVPGIVVMDSARQ